MGTAFRYEMRCYTKPETLVSDRQFLNKAIPVHESLLPNPKVGIVKLQANLFQKYFFHGADTQDSSLQFKDFADVKIFT